MSIRYRKRYSISLTIREMNITDPLRYLYMNVRVDIIQEKEKKLSITEVVEK
jgi:hypothetical protein